MGLEHAPDRLVVRRRDGRDRIVDETLKGRSLGLSAESPPSALLVQNPVGVGGRSLLRGGIEVLGAGIVLQPRVIAEFENQTLTL